MKKSTILMSIEIDPDKISEIFDEELIQLENLRWLPWVGKDYLKPSYKTLVLGESHYDWGDQDSIQKLNDINFSRFVIEEQALSHVSDWQKKDGEKNWPAFRNIERALFATKEPTTVSRENLWQSVAFANLTQRYMLHLKDRPSSKDYFDGWLTILEVVKILKPNFCLVLGTEQKKVNAFEKVLKKKSLVEKKDKVDWIQKIGRTYLKKILVKNEEDLATSFIFIKHPSQYFSWRSWSSTLQKELSLYLAQI